MPAPAQPFLDAAVDPKVRGFLHRPDVSNGSAIVLTHGAGSSAKAPLLGALGETFCSVGFTVLRCDLPYRQKRSFGPPGPGDAARDRTGLKNAIAAAKNTLSEAPPFAMFKGWGSVFLAGHSYGGRQSSILCAELGNEDPGLVAGLMLLSYPLHPPRKPEQQRTQHLPDLRTPALFVHGTRDPFGSTAELQKALKMIPARTELLEIEGAGHDLGFKGKTRRAELPGLILTVFSRFFDLSS